MPSAKVLFDANVLYPAPLRDLLMHLALTRLFTAKWTDEIHEEWIRNVLRKRTDLSRKMLERTRRLMDAKAKDALITGYEGLIPTLELPDPKDRHVLAAAIHANVSIIVTFNLADFPNDILRSYAIEAIPPDDFAIRLVAKSLSDVLEAVRRQRAGLRNPPKTPTEFIETIREQRLPRFADFLSKHQAEI
jgi:predicted nucleic acid-binding protein